MIKYNKTTKTTYSLGSDIFAMCMTILTILFAPIGLMCILSLNSLDTVGSPSGVIFCSTVWIFMVAVTIWQWLSLKGDKDV